MTLQENTKINIYNKQLFIITMALNNFDSLITWSEFTTVPSRPAGVQEDAEIRVNSSVRYRTRRHGNAISIADATVNITTVTATSWVVSDKKTALLLKHEQGHYDITALGTREFYTQLLTLTADSTNALDVKIAALKQQFQQKIDACNMLYDTRTDHSLISSVQDTWNQKIASAKVNPAGTINDLPS
jgi:predicted secreted Zn-dependent protease